MKLAQIVKKMDEYNQSVAYGSECDAWVNFADDAYNRYDTAPWEDRAQDIEADPEFVEYWLAVINGTNDDYNADGGQSNA